MLKFDVYNLDCCQFLKKKKFLECYLDHASLFFPRGGEEGVFFLCVLEPSSYHNKGILLISPKEG
jgi:hypothetical protein